ncbi:hypothetical protein QYE76_026679 [Lolium multiflorum]|uniref:F-box domain-containing protein n=1 Tax=Lolium multiflorum TaxID=4521 RepID=A0AAD8RJ21_LOLMU|nr:hypothetical protein QYE76_026679 [Lolium multiflorum]
METAACWIERLPEELLAAVISLTSPPDACRVAAVSRAFLAAADSDDVWSRFLPGDLPRFVDAYESFLMALPSCKARFLRLSDDPALLLGRVTRMWLDKATGGKCYMLSARALNISWGDEPNYWRWIHLDVLHHGKRITCEAAQLLHVAWLEVRGKIDSRMLSPNSAYGVYLVFRLDPKTHGLGFPFQEGLINVGGSVSTRRACLHGYDEDGAGGVVPRKYVVDSTHTYWPRTSSSHTVLVEDDVTLPQRRADGWLELELADGFYNHEDDDGEVRVALNETKRLYSKGGLIVRSIEFRIKQQNI